MAKINKRKSNMLAHFVLHSSNGIVMFMKEISHIDMTCVIKFVCLKVHKGKQQSVTYSNCKKKHSSHSTLAVHERN